ncbi:MAG: DNA adenine methylase [Kiritimatiellae bacterium]|nr:DNA adenine methylase [Kiritimatiellia bacterium]
MKRETIKPFIKWAGGKTQLLPELDARLPEDFKRTVRVYAEPFVGGGALLFHLLAKGLRPERVVVNDSNPDLANAWRVVQSHAAELVEALDELQTDYRARTGEEDRRAFYLAVRDAYNAAIADCADNPVRRTARMLFLNRTCFNGLYRVNAKGAFNVPFGRYANPRICDRETLLADSAALAGVEILDGDFADALAGAGPDWFVYFDPPYRPISATSGFRDYTQGGFDDREQHRLADVCRTLDRKGVRWLLSNSDPKGTDPGDTFFDGLYAGFDIRGVQASRMVNAKADRRGKLGEILVSNFTNGVPS